MIKSTKLWTILIVLFGTTIFVDAQKPARKPAPPTKPVVVVKPKIVVNPQVTVILDESDRSENDSGVPVEKTIQVEPKVNIAVCTIDGNVKIRGSERNEVRVFVENGSNAGFKTIAKNKESNKATSIKILSFDPNKDSENLDECLFGEIEIDLPVGATVSVKNREAAVSIESVNKVRVESQDGEIHVKEIKNGADVSNREGSITIEDVTGQVSLQNFNGAINVFDVRPNDVTETLSAKTVSGKIALQSIKHSEVHASSISGSITFFGEMASAGNYEFQTTSSGITFLIPQNSSFKINASHTTDASFSSDFTLKNLKTTSNFPTKKLSGTYADGDANLTITTFTGKIRIKKKP